MQQIDRLGRRAWLAHLLATGAMVTLVPAVLAAARLPKDRSIYKMEGRVLVNGQPANPETKIGGGDTVETGPDASITFAVDTDAFRMRSDSQVQLERSSSRSVGLLRILTGAILSVYGKGQKRIHTPAATIGIRGTGTYVDVTDTRTYFCCCYGEAEMVAAGSDAVRETVVTGYHESPRYISMGANPQIIAAPVIDHGDDELAILESLVGRVPPFYNPSSADGAGYD
jgi:hypothetical protein